MSVGWYVMIGLDDFALVLSRSCDHFACVFPPFSIDLLEVVGSRPLLYYAFILLRWLLWYIRQCSSLNEHFFWKYHDILIVFFTLVVVGSPGQHVCTPVFSFRYVL